MYRHPAHRLDDRAALFDLIDAHPLAIWVCHGRSGLVAHHGPVTLDRTRGPNGTLRACFIRDSTEDLPDIADGTLSLVVFRGAQHYITPGWYPGKAEHGRVVPTWNYVVVHAHGVARRTADGEGIELPIHRLEGKLKASQDEHRPDREGTVAGLNSLDTDSSRTMAALVQHTLNNPST